MDCCIEDVSFEMGETEDQPSKEFMDFFDKLDKAINGELIEKAWKQFDTISQQIILEGNKNLWMACSFYTTVLESVQSTQEPSFRYSVLKLINLCDSRFLISNDETILIFSILDFFDRLDKWAIIISAPKRLLDRINRVQSNLATSAVVFKKFLPIFRQIFSSSCFLPSPAKIRKAEISQTGASDLFEIIWLAFLAIKKELTHSNENLLNSFHLLLCIIDRVLLELKSLKLEKSLNKEFINVLMEKDVLDTLCYNFGGVVLDAKHLRSYWLPQKLKDMLDRRILRSHEGQNVFFVSELKANKKSLEKVYETKISCRGEIDERIFLKAALQNFELVFNADFDENVISVLQQSNDGQPRIGSHHLLQITTQQCLAKVTRQQIQSQTLAKQKSYVVSTDQFCFSSPPAKNSHQKLQKLTELINASLPSNIDTFFKSLKDHILSRVKVFGDRFVNKVGQEKRLRAFSSDGLETKRMHVEKLFYRLLHKVIDFEKQRSKDPEVLKNLNTLLQNTEFVASIYICALEIVLFCSDISDELVEFPWSADLVGVAPLSYFKIIETVIRADAEIPRDMIKHLNRIEERILEELGWRSTSSLWGKLSRCNGGDIPKSDLFFNELRVNSLPKQQSPLIVLFFRKLYYLAAMRILDLCDRVHMEEIGQRRVWTLFEYVLRNETSLMMERHLDQNLMCCIYIVSKISNYEISFHDIMYYYRHQPQASSRVYRHVLMESSISPVTVISTDDSASRDSQTSVSISGGRYRSQSALPVPEVNSNPSAPPTPDLFSNQDFADLIKYYNRVFVSRVEEFLRLLAPSSLAKETTQNITPVELIPLPKDIVAPLSPRRMVNNQINIVSISTTHSMHMQSAHMRWDLNRSPSKNLKDINAIVSAGVQ